MRSIIIICIAITAYLQGNAQKFEKFAHRGGRGLMPENTIIAMQNAMDFGASLEMDLYLTIDNQVIVFHDGFISPVYSTNADGTSVTKEQSKKKKITEYTYSELKGFDIGSKSNPEFPRKKNVEAHIPLFASLVDSVELYAKNGKLKSPSYSIEIKVPSGKIPALYKQKLVDAAMKIVSEKNILDRVIVQSFDADALEYLNKNYPLAKTAYLVFIGKDDYKANMQKLSFKPTAYSPHYKQVTKEMIKYCHKNKIQVITWTVNSREEIQRLKKMDVDVVISDYPDYFEPAP